MLARLSKAALAIRALARVGDVATPLLRGDFITAGAGEGERHRQRKQHSSLTHVANNHFFILRRQAASRSTSRRSSWHVQFDQSEQLEPTPCCDRAYCVPRAGTAEHMRVEVARETSSVVAFSRAACPASTPPPNYALQQTGLSVASLPLAPAAERRHVGRTERERVFISFRSSRGASSRIEIVTGSVVLRRSVRPAA